MRLVIVILALLIALPVRAYSASPTRNWSNWNVARRYCVSRSWQQPRCRKWSW